VAEARNELNRSLAVQAAYVVVLGALLVVALGQRAQGVWVFAAAVAAAEILRLVGYLGLMRRTVGLTMAQLWAAWAPALLASLGVALAVAAVRDVLVGRVPALLALTAEVAAGALALALCLRFGPIPAIRRELWMRLTAAGVIGGAGGVRRRVASLVLGRPEPAPEPSA
jgi:hypothetical protein